MAGQTVFSEMWKAYRGVVLHSIVTSFGLDFIVRDQHGGDIDTIHGVRETSQYKNTRNAAASGVGPMKIEHITLYVNDLEAAKKK